MISDPSKACQNQAVEIARESTATFIFPAKSNGSSQEINNNNNQMHTAPLLKWVKPSFQIMNIGKISKCG